MKQLLVDISINYLSRTDDLERHAGEGDISSKGAYIILTVYSLCNGAPGKYIYSTLEIRSEKPKLISFCNVVNVGCVCFLG